MTNPDDLHAPFAALRNSSLPPRVDIADRVIAAIRTRPSRKASVSNYAMLVSAAICAIAASIALLASSFSESASTTITDANDVVRSAYEIDLPSLLQ